MKVRATYLFLISPSSFGSPGRAREPVRGGVPGVRDRDHEVGLDRCLAGEDLAHPAADLLQDAPLDPRVRPGEVDVLEDAVGLAPGGHDLPALESVGGQRDRLAGIDFANQLRADDVERAALGGDAPGLVVEPAERQRTDPVRVAERDHGALRHHDGRVGAPKPRHHGGDRVLDRALLVDRGNAAMISESEVPRNPIPRSLSSL